MAKKNNNKTNEVQENRNQETKEVKIQKKGTTKVKESKEHKVDWKSIGKKALIGVGAAGAVALAFGAGVLAGRSSGGSDDPETEAEVIPTEEQTDVQVTEF